MSTSILAIALAIIFPFSAISQDKETKVTVKTVKEKNGQIMVYDTSFTVKEGEDIDEILKPLSWTSNADSGKIETFDVEVELDTDEDIDVKEIIVYNRGNRHIEMLEGDEPNVFIIEKKGDKNYDENIFFAPKNKRVIKWVDGDSTVYEFRTQNNIDWLYRDMKAQRFDMREMQRELQEELINIESLSEEQQQEILGEITDIDFDFIMPPVSPKPPRPIRGENYKFYFDGPNNVGVSDIELREANIKNKPDRLDLKTVDVDIENGVVDISFQVDGEANPSLVVYNIYGDKVFSGKPALMNGNFEFKIDLSQKQHGTYYWQIVDKDRSFTDKFRL